MKLIYHKLKNKYLKLFSYDLYGMKKFNSHPLELHHALNLFNGFIQLLNRFLEHGVDEVRGYFGEGNQDKSPLVHLGVGDDKTGDVNYLVAEEDDININNPRLAGTAIPPHLLLDALE